MTRKQFRQKAEAAFKKANPAASIEWIEARFVTYPTGYKGWYGKIAATAPGYKSRVMIAMGDDTYMMVR